MTTRVTKRNEPPEMTTQPTVTRRAPSGRESLRVSIEGEPRQALAGLQPGDPGVAPEPGFLAAGEAAGGAHGLVASLVAGQLPVEVPEHLLVAEGAARGLAVAEAARAQLSHLGREARRPHAVHAGLDPAVKLLARQLDAELDRGAASVVTGHRRAERTTGQLDDLKGAHDPAAVAGQDGGRRGGVRRGQARVERGRARDG